MFKNYGTFIIRAQSSIVVNRPLETVALYVSDQDHFRQWHSGILMKPSQPARNKTLEVSNYLPFKMITFVDNNDEKWIERTLVFEFINVHKTNLIFIEKRRIKGITAVILFPVLKIFIAHQMKKRLNNLKNQLETVEPQRIAYPQSMSLWGAKPFPRLIKESPRFY